MDKFIQIDQILIALTGIIAVWLSQGSDKQQKYACIFGLIGEPAWFYTAYVNNQYGILLLCIFYTLAWFKGFKKYWM